jgi:hypothetical protein
VNQNNKGNVFLAEGKHTFFIPVDEGFKVTPILSKRLEITHSLLLVIYWKEGFRYGQVFQILSHFLDV